MTWAIRLKTVVIRSNGLGYPFEKSCHPFEGLAFFSAHERKWNLCVGYSLVFCEKILIITVANGPQVTIVHALTNHGKDVTNG